ncbi:hypothetical protein [Angustibacter aerolatus]|uniref:Uncharacterized protein n=1 Tax=Angustibacter aerolatus TaxID=1162965 RepID=A0ABQ6JJS1_9ACTN|nr:hypothetical protein GCM10025868_29130 [Angustibacter aerolatus]
MTDSEHPHEHDLVEPEGVNSGSDRIHDDVDDTDETSDADLVGGRPQDAPVAEDDGPDASHSPVESPGAERGA